MRVTLQSMFMVREAREVLANPDLHPNTEVVVRARFVPEAIKWYLNLDGRHGWRWLLADWILKPLIEERLELQVLLDEAYLHVYAAGPTPELRFTNSKIPSVVMEQRSEQPRRPSRWYPVNPPLGPEHQISAGQRIERRDR
jgi:hypothetical protein